MKGCSLAHRHTLGCTDTGYNTHTTIHDEYMGSTRLHLIAAQVGRKVFTPYPPHQPCAKKILSF